MSRDGYGDYQSPLSARSSIAGIDAVMVAQAVEQMEGEELAKVVHASILRLQKLSLKLAIGLTSNDLLG